MSEHEYAPCPQCSSSKATKVGFTWWGGLVGPRLLTHVKCQDCGTTYNGKTGRSNTGAIIVYTLVLLAILTALGALGYQV
jgi:transposase-like protein